MEKSEHLENQMIGESAGSMPLISVVVPVYNGEEFLQACIDSVLQQTYPHLELLLLDDGSADGSGAICDRAAASDERVRVIHKANEGLMATWMRGVRESKGEYVSFLDCDDWLETDHLEKLTACLTAEADCRQIVCGGYVIEREWNHTKEPKSCAAAPGVYEGERLQKELKDRLLGNENRPLILSRCMKLIARELLLDNLHFCNPQIRMGEDLNITVPVLLDADRVVVLQDNYDYHYRFVASSMAHGYDGGMQENLHLLCRTLHQVMAEKAYPNGAMQVERERLIQLCYVLKNELRRTDAPGAEVVRQVRRLCAEEQASELLKRSGIRMQEKANQLLALVMAHPSNVRIRLVRRIFLLQQRH